MLKAVIWAAAVARKEEATLKHLPDEYKEPANEPQQLLSYIFQVSGKLCSGWYGHLTFQGRSKVVQREDWTFHMLCSMHNDP